MTLPKFIRRAPLAFYVIGGVSLFVGIVLPLLELRNFGFSTDLPDNATIERGVVLKFVIRQIVSSSYLFANGLVLDVLIRIWDKLDVSMAGAAE